MCVCVREGGGCLRACVRESVCVCVCVLRACVCVCVRDSSDTTCGSVLVVSILLRLLVHCNVSRLWFLTALVRSQPLQSNSVCSATCSFENKGPQRLSTEPVS